MNLPMCRDQNIFCAEMDDKKDMWKLKGNSCLFQKYRPEKIDRKAQSWISALLEWNLEETIDRIFIKPFFLLNQIAGRHSHHKEAVQQLLSIIKVVLAPLQQVSGGIRYLLRLRLNKENHND